MKAQCDCTHDMLKSFGFKESEIKGHAPCCPLFDPKQYSHPLEDDLASDTAIADGETTTHHEQVVKEGVYTQITFGGIDASGPIAQSWIKSEQKRQRRLKRMMDEHPRSWFRRLLGRWPTKPRKKSISPCGQPIANGCYWPYGTTLKGTGCTFFGGSFLSRCLLRLSN